MRVRASCPDSTPLARVMEQRFHAQRMIPFFRLSDRKHSGVQIGKRISKRSRECRCSQGGSSPNVSALSTALTIDRNSHKLNAVKWVSKNDVPVKRKSCARKF